MISPQPIYRLTLTLQALRNLGGKLAPSHIVINALLKSIHPHYSADAPPPRIAFNIKLPFYQACIRKASVFEVELLLFGASSATVQQWSVACQHYLANQQHGFALLQLSEAALQQIDFTPQPQDLTTPHAELLLTTPLPFDRKHKKNRTHITPLVFFSQLHKRVQALLSYAPHLPDLSGVYIQHWYWHYDEVRHRSKSQPGHTQYFSGCVGSLYFYGDLAKVMPWLRVAAAIHAGGKLELNFMGHCRLYTPARTKFTALHTMRYWQSVAHTLENEISDFATQCYAKFGVEQITQQQLQSLITQAVHEKYTPEPPTVFSVQKQQGIRNIEQYPISTRLIIQAVCQLITPYANLTFEPTTHGFRAGFSTHTALAQIRQCIAQGYQYVLESDIADFFPSVHLAKLTHILDCFLPPADHTLRQLIQKLIHTPYYENGALHPRTQGLSIGSPLSPLLANLYLDSFDEAIGQDPTIRLIRYADDFVILTRTLQQAQEALLQVQQQLAKLDLSINIEKTAIKPIAEGFSFLGQTISSTESNPASSPLQPAKKTLYLTEPYTFLGHNGDALEIKRNNTLLEIIPLRKISDIIILTHAGMSTHLIQKCATLHIPITMTLNDGYHVTTLTPDSRQYYGLARQQALHYHHLSDTERLSIAQQFAAQKIRNYVPIVQSRYQKGNHVLVQQLESCTQRIAQTTEVASIRGIEGYAAKLWLNELRARIKNPVFNFKKRDRKAGDHMNSLFNFSYYLLFTRINTLVRSKGLNPYLGYLHEGEDNYETLVCDIEELFRAPIDHALLNMINLKIITEHHFQTTAQGERLNKNGIKAFLTYFEKTLHTSHHGITLLFAIETQITHFAKFIQGQQALWLYQYKASS